MIVVVVIVVLSVVLLLAVALAVVLVAAFRTATLKPAKSLRNIRLCMWAMRLQLRYDRRWLP